jgi:hypothetical protein
LPITSTSTPTKPPPLLGVRLGVVGILAREDVKIFTVYVDLSVICVGLEVRVNNSGGFVWSIKVCISNGWGCC